MSTRTVPDDIDKAMKIYVKELEGSGFLTYNMKYWQGMITKFGEEAVKDTYSRISSSK